MLTAATNMLRRSAMQNGQIAARMFSTSRLFTEDHEWVTVDKESKIATVGITDYAASLLGDLVYIELPAVGADLARQDSAGAIESVKASSEVYSPVTGKIVEVNDSLTDSSNMALINEKPFSDGWMFKIQMSDDSELAGMMSEDKYRDYVESTK
ncbi:glycine cleavage system H protein [Fonticula alba]|uniref:Glycine cleavage system H protein n=1 Tax=Fonticula alba TaxID=691883 RepID=A0A058ZEF9_FONAL|nr:glycine cleavage system H protein [Fonticula alba]KCV72331.1 glycine cleavage system H protein [Fonticula alba]|eukprot:XP_009493909.1 glycine cleavage system H protein [Fonticula alba]